MSDSLNVVLVVIDGARADHLGCQGHVRDTTPFLDGVAREGVRFNAAFATAPGTAPAHASIFTGLFASTHGATEESPSLGPRHATLAEVLRHAGFRTAGFCSDPRVSPATGFARGFDVFRTLRGDGRSISRAAFYARRATDRLLRRADAGARRTNLDFFDWLDAGDAPFFAYLHYAEPRLSRQPPAPYERLFLAPDVKRAELRAVERAWSRDGTAHGGDDAEKRALLESVYDGALRYVDSRLAELADRLREKRVWDRTVFVVTADHGQDLGEHFGIGSTSGLFDTQLHVPLVLRCPPCVPQGFVVEELAQHVDVMPTVLQLVGLENALPAAHGRALLRDGRVAAGPPFAVAERFRPDLGVLARRFPRADLAAFDVRERALRTRREKFIWRSDEENHFYDLVADPGERINCIDQERGRAAVLRSQLFDWLASIERPPAEEGAVIEEATRKRA